MVGNTIVVIDTKVRDFILFTFQDIQNRTQVYLWRSLS